MLKEDLANISQKTSKNLLTTFTDFLDYTIGFFGVGDTKKIEGWSYTPEQNKLFYDALRGLVVNEYKPGIDKRGWHDPLGDSFMDLCRGFVGKNGQFFTPPDVCDLMAMTTMNGSEPEGNNTHFGKRPVIGDPTCGSARNLLAAYNRAIVELKWKRKCYLIGEDLDPLCVKMSAINLCLHGAFGEVVCHDTLSEPKGVRFGYIINETMYPIPTPIPSIRYSEDPRDFYVCDYGAK